MGLNPDDLGFLGFVGLLPVVMAFAILPIYIMFHRAGIRRRKESKITRENSTPMEAELFCFVSPSQSAGGVMPFRHPDFHRIPNMDKYRHMITEWDTNMYSVNNGRWSLPVVILNIYGEDFLAYGHRNERLRTEDLGRRVRILYREYEKGFLQYSFILDDEQSLIDEEIRANSKTIHWRRREYPGSNHRTRCLSTVIIERKTQALEDEFKKKTSKSTQIIGKFIEVLIPVAVFGGVFYLILRLLGVI